MGGYGREPIDLIHPIEKAGTSEHVLRRGPGMGGEDAPRDRLEAVIPGQRPEGGEVLHHEAVGIGHRLVHRRIRPHDQRRRIVSRPVITAVLGHMVRLQRLHPPDRVGEVRLRVANPRRDQRERGMDHRGIVEREPLVRPRLTADRMDQPAACAEGRFGRFKGGRRPVAP